MSPEWKQFLFYYLPLGTIYTPIAITYLMVHLLPYKKQLKDPGRIFLCYFVPIFLLTLHRTWTNSSLSAMLLQLSILLNCLFLFEGKLRSRLAAFYIVFSILFTNESLAMALAPLSHWLLTGHMLSHVNLTLLQDIPDMLLVNFWYISVGSLILWISGRLLKHCRNIIPIGTIGLLLLPIQLTALGQGILPVQASTQTFYFAVFLYILLSAAGYLPVFKGLGRISKEAGEAAKNEAKLSLYRKQLDTSKKFAKNYQQLRKWNHDLENHLFSLTWLLEQKQYTKATEYLHEMETSSAVTSAAFSKESE